jgi:hypothetical protein
MIERRLVSPDELNVLAVERDLDIRIRDITQGRNVASIDNYGYNASLSGSIDSSRWEYALNATGSIARRDDGGGDYPLTLAPPLFGNASVSYTIGGPWPTVSLGLHYVSQRIMDRAFTGGFSRLQTVPPRLDVQTSVLGPFPFVPGLDYIASLFVASNNTSPWSIGPTINAAIGPTLEPAPIDPLRILLGLSYSLPSEK